MVRRIGRLWPTHIATTLLDLVEIRHLPSFGEALALATMSQGLNFSQAGIGNPGSWSASDEVYVHLVFGAVCILIRGSARIAVFTTLALTTYALAAWMEVERGCLFRGGCLDALVHQFGWLRCIAGFFAGTLVYEFQDRLITLVNGPVFQATDFSASLFFLLLSANALPGSALAAPLVFAALIGSLISDRGPVARTLQAPGALYLGKVSHPLYLGHGVMIPLVVTIPADAGLMRNLIAYTLLLFGQSPPPISCTNTSKFRFAADSIHGLGQLPIQLPPTLRSKTRNTTYRLEVAAAIAAASSMPPGGIGRLVNKALEAVSMDRRRHEMTLQHDGKQRQQQHGNNLKI